MSRTTVWTLVMVVAALLAIPLVGSRYLIDLSTEIAIYALFALSLNILLGYAGNVSFGHAAYFAIGGYTCAILLTTYEWPWWISIPVAVLLSACAALLIGYFCVRLTNIYFAMLTLAFSMLVWSVAFKWRPVTGGDDGFVGVILPPFLETRLVFFYFVVSVVTLSTAILWLICHSAFGRSLVAVRENPTRANFVGINVRRMRLIAFVIAGTFAGIAGTLFAMYNRGMYTESAFWTESAQILIMTLLGGIYSFFGPALGAAVLHLLDVTINQYTQYWPVVLGTILILLVLFLPEGLMGLAQRVRRYLARSS